MSFLYQALCKKFISIVLHNHPCDSHSFFFFFVIGTFKAHFLCAKIGTGRTFSKEGRRLNLVRKWEGATTYFGKLVICSDRKLW